MYKDHNYYVYIMINQRHTTLYVGVTSEIIGRPWQHKNKFYNGFTKKYNINKLVYFEHFDDIETAILREKQIKKYSHRKKVIMINKFNPEWNDLYETISQ